MQQQYYFQLLCIYALRFSFRYTLCVIALYAVDIYAISGDVINDCTLIFCFLMGFPIIKQELKILRIKYGCSFCGYEQLLLWVMTVLIATGLPAVIWHSDSYLLLAGAVLWTIVVFQETQPNA